METVTVRTGHTELCFLRGRYQWKLTRAYFLSWGHTPQFMSGNLFFLNIYKEEFFESTCIDYLAYYF